MSKPISATIHVRGDPSDPGDLVETVDRVSESGDLLLDPGVDGGDVGAQGVDAGQHPAQQEGVVLGEVADEGLLEHGDLASHPGVGQLRQHLRVALAADQRIEHRPPRHPEDVRGDDRHLDLGVFEQLLNPVLLPDLIRQQCNPLCRGSDYAELLMKVLVGGVASQVSSA
jgi:hypothetical protein